MTSISHKHNRKKLLAAALSARLVIAVLAAASAFSAQAATDWTQSGGNPRRTHFTPDSPAPPYEPVWRVDFSPEGIYSAQPAVVEGRLFATTLNGNLYALDANTGKRLWHFKAGKSVWGGAAAGNEAVGGQGLVFCASWDGSIYGITAADGQEVWRFDAAERISASPCLADNTLFLGTRKGRMLALGADGTLRWDKPLPRPVFGSAAYDAGRVYVPTEDMRLHCLDAGSGETIWTSEKLYGFTFRDYFPVLHKGKVMVSTAPVIWREHAGDPEGFYSWAASVPLELHNKYFKPLTGDNKPSAPHTSIMANGRRIPPEIEESLMKLPAYYEANPAAQSFFVLDQADGRQSYYAVHHFCGGGLENLPPPPAVCHDGTVALPCFIAMARQARLDIEKNQWVDILFESQGANNDDSEMLSVGGTRVFTRRRLAAIDIVTRARGEFNVDSAIKGMEAERISVLPFEQPEYRAARPGADSYTGITCGERVYYFSSVFPHVIYGDMVFVNIRCDYNAPVQRNTLVCFRGGGR